MDPSRRRILSLWFPRLAAERALRLARGGAAGLAGPLAVVGDQNGAQVIVSLAAEAEAAGLTPGQPLRDATAMCPALVTVPADPAGEAAFLTGLRRWAGKFSPWVAEEPPAGLVVDLTGCAHLFGGEAALLAQVEADCAALGLSLRAAIADTPGAAWALSRHAGQGVPVARSGDAIQQEAHATRSRAAKRRGWEKGGVLPVAGAVAEAGPRGVIAPPGKMRQALGPLPVAALRLPPEAVEGLVRLGLRQVEDIAVLPRAALARRFGAMVLRRLDQALGLEPEPVTPAGAPLHFAARISLPDPIGLLSDVEAAVDRLLPVLCARLVRHGRGARRVRLQAFRADGQVEVAEVGLARASDRVDRIRPLLWMKLGDLDAGFGIDMLRLEAVLTEPLSPVQHRAPSAGGAGDALPRGGAGDALPRGGASAALPREAAGDAALDDLIGKLGVRLGTEAVTRFHPGESHLPEKGAQVLAAAWSRPFAGPWPRRAARPLMMFRPEPLGAPEGDPTPPARFRWRRRERVTRVAVGPERIAPEWWLDDPDWRSGPRDYWWVETEEGERLWLFYAHGGEVSGGWFCHGGD
ncbi:Y-family DNA polymerase [Paragemmobacter ruber]|uniref:DNA polymerase Y family protein n=1 Tax=Paragemmobacter ruber TaxID=1985673 RepID=A0ABW9Y9L0_9RHOB|nr:DNA polymerase Y family protein [Rhodobacter ruber]NBE09271.1 DNA polymerase Y family protein [Rhodobacter ruber]